MPKTLRQRPGKNVIEKQANFQPVVLSRDCMKSAFPQHTGLVLKLHVPVFYAILPSFIQSFVKRIVVIVGFKALTNATLPQWKPRELVLLGSYLYKFVENEKTPKGTPILIQSVEINMISSHDFTRGTRCELMGQCSGFFSVSSLRKKYIFACKNETEARIWVNSLLQAQQEAIRRSMGHAQSDSYPEKWDQFDVLGSNLVKNKQRIQTRIERQSILDNELSGLTGGPIPRGYYG